MRSRVGLPVEGAPLDSGGAMRLGGYPNKEVLFVAVVEAESEQFLKTVRKSKFPEGRFADTLKAMALAYSVIVRSTTG